MSDVDARVIAMGYKGLSRCVEDLRHQAPGLVTAKPDCLQGIGNDANRDRILTDELTQVHGEQHLEEFLVDMRRGHGHGPVDHMVRLRAN